MARWISQHSRKRTLIEIHPGAILGHGIFIDHGAGVVIGETAEVGDNCLIYQCVTLGGTGKDIGKRHPTLGKNVMVGAGAQVLGPIYIGDNCKVASNAVVLNSVPAGTTVAGMPAKSVVKRKKQQHMLYDDKEINNDGTNTIIFLKESNSNDKIRIFCFPYAGGGASAYRNWGTYLPDYVGVYPIQIPGRENRITEKALTDMCELTDKIVSAIHPYLDTPYLVFGHSLGAKISYEVCNELREKQDNAPCHLIVSGSRAPHIPEPEPLHHLQDVDFIEAMKRYSGMSKEFLENRDLLNLFCRFLELILFWTRRIALQSMRNLIFR